MTPQNTPYDFRHLIDQVKDMNYLDILQYAEKEADRVESISYGKKGAVRAREQGSARYVDQIGAFLFWMKSGRRPAGATDEDFQFYRIVAEKLVEKKQFNPQVLEMFRQE